MVAIREIRGCALNVFLAGGRHVIERHEPVRIAERQRLQQDAVDDAVDGRCCADAQCECEDCDSREPRLSPQQSDGITRDDPCCLEPGKTTNLALRLLDLGEPTEVLERSTPRFLAIHAARLHLRRSPVTRRLRARALRRDALLVYSWRHWSAG